jgi:hypothetical protein
MAKITVYIPDPKDTYQRQIVAAIDTLKNQLNFSFQEDLKQEVERMNWYLK